jgi:hypothetical protein
MLATPFGSFAGIAAPNPGTLLRSLGRNAALDVTGLSRYTAGVDELTGPRPQRRIV